MIRSVNNYPISQLFDINANVVYAIPRYQREYTWGKPQWENLFDDLLENDPGYFLGSIICINQSADALAVQSLELVDGQQRLTTISLLFAAIYELLVPTDDQNDDDILVERTNLKRKMVLRTPHDQMRVVPQIQNKNQEDYRGILSNIGVIPPYEMPLNAGNRRVVKAFRYFKKRLNDMAGEGDGRSASLISFVDKLSRASLVKIEVASHTDAYILFESLNDRGIPLTAVDLIKNKMLAQIERGAPEQVDYYFDQWRTMLDNIGDEYAVQERFLRQYYNAFRDELRTIVDVPMAIRSNLIGVFERLINQDARECLTKVSAAARDYSFILGRRHEESLRDLIRPLKDLERIQGSPSYVLLMNLVSRRRALNLTNEHLASVVNTLVRFFVRRNLTDTPPTNEVTRLPIRILEDIAGKQGDEVVEIVQQKLAAVSAPDEEFRRRLEGPIYEENVGVARFVLIALAEQAMTNEAFTDLWEEQNGKPKWTIEHVFPQGENIPDSWVQMIAEGDETLAKQYQQTYVHRLGNLTITGYNSSLGNKSFQEKQDRTDSEGRFVGYRNGLGLNSELASADAFRVDQIIARGAILVERALDIFRL